MHSKELRNKRQMDELELEYREEDFNIEELKAERDFSLQIKDITQNPAWERVSEFLGSKKDELNNIIKTSKDANTVFGAARELQGIGFFEETIETILLDGDEAINILVKLGAN